MANLWGIKIPALPSVSLRRKRKSKDPLRLSARKRYDPSVEEGRPEEILGLTVTAHELDDVLMVAGFDQSVLGRVKSGIFGRLAFWKRRGSENGQQNGRAKVWRNLVYHTRPISQVADSKGDLVAGLNRMFITYGDTKLDNVINILLCSVPKDVGPFLDHMERVKKLGNQAYKRFINEVIGYALGDYDGAYDGRTINGRDMIVWAKSEAFLGAGKGGGASYGGWLMPFSLAGTFLHSVIHRLPRKLLVQPLEPLEVACPIRPYWGHDFYVLGLKKEGYRAFAIWKGVLHHEHLRDLLAANLDLDVWIQCERIGTNLTGRDLYVTVLLRTSSQIENGRMPKIEETERRLNLMGEWHRVKGVDLRKAFRAFVPGSPPLHALRDKSLTRFRHTIPTGADEFLHDLTSKVGGAGKIEGDSFLGFREDDGTPYFFDRRKYQHIVSLGKGGRGKTTYTSALLALQETPYVLVAQLTIARGEGAMTWAVEFGGRVYPVSLHDFLTEHEEKDAFNKDENDARAFVQEMAKKWWQSGQPWGLPLVIRPTVKSLRYLHFVQIVMEEFAIRWGHWVVPPGDREREELNLLEWENGFAGYEKAERPLAIAEIDDNYGWPHLTRDTNLGELPIDVGKKARDLMVDMVDGFHKQGGWVNLTTHSEEELRDFTPGFDESVPMEIHFKITPYRHAVVRNPAKRDEVIVKLLTEFSHGMLSTVMRTS